MRTCRNEHEKQIRMNYCNDVTRPNEMKFSSPAGGALLFSAYLVYDPLTRTNSLHASLIYQGRGVQRHGRLDERRGEA